MTTKPTENYSAIQVPHFSWDPAFHLLAAVAKTIVNCHITDYLLLNDE